MVMKTKKTIYFMCQKLLLKNVHLLLIEENNNKKHYVLVKGFNTLLHDPILPAFSTEEILKCHINDCFKSNGKQMTQILKESGYLKSKNYEKK